MEITVKIIQIGSSYGIIIPKVLIEHNGLLKGQLVKVSITPVSNI